MSKRSHSSATPSALPVLLSGVGLLIAAFLLTVLLFAAVTYLMKDPTGLIPLLSLPAFIVAGGLGARLLPRERFATLGVRLLCATVFLCLLLLVGVIARHGAMGLQILLYDGCYLCSFALGSLVRLRQPRRRRHAHR